MSNKEEDRTKNKKPREKLNEEGLYEEIPAVVAKQPLIDGSGSHTKTKASSSATGSPLFIENLPSFQLGPRSMLKLDFIKPGNSRQGILDFGKVSGE